MYKYLQNTAVSTRMKTIAKDVETELRNVQHLTKVQLDLASWWRDFLREHVKFIHRQGTDWLENQIKLAKTSNNAALNNYKRLKARIERLEGAGSPNKIPQ